MKQYTVTGMSCAACQARVEKAVGAVPGVTACSVSLLTNSMGVEGTADESAVIAAVEKAGYGAAPKGASRQNHDRLAAEEDALKDRETPRLLKRLFLSLGFLLVLMALSMGHTMLRLPVPPLLDNPPALATAQMLLAIAVLFINRQFFVSGLRGLPHGGANMDTLVALGSSAAFLYSLAELFLIFSAVTKGDVESAHDLVHTLYFETAAMIPCLITVGKTLEAKSKGRTTDALKSLMKLAPKTALLVTENGTREVGVEEVKTGDIFAVKPGENVPVDGVIVKGETAVNEAALTGESLPIDKAEGDAVSAATVNLSGYIEARATRVGEDTTLAQIVRMVSDAAATKAPIARIADKVSGVFVPVVIGIALVTLGVWLVAGETFGFALTRAVSVLVISCPCALGLATPVAIMVGNGVGAKNGILFKTAVAQEETGKLDVIALDKTGTVTAGEPKVTDLLPADGVSETELLALAASLESKSEHPLAKAVLACAAERGVAAAEVENFRALPGNGLTAEQNGDVLTGGSVAFLRETVGENPLTARAAALADSGKTPLVFARNDALLGVIAVADAIKPDSAAAIRDLKKMGLTVVLLTGDNERTAKAVGAEAGVDRVIAGVLPDGKQAVIRDLQKTGKVGMVGDGINDAPALVQADVGIAIGAGTDVAIDAADVVLMKSSLADVAAAVRLSRATVRNIHQNLFWAFFYNLVCIPLAAGLTSALFHWDFQMNPMVGAAAMSLSSFTVCMNALRLNLVKVHDASRNKAKKHKSKKQTTEETTMTKTMTIEGMMCPHCEAAVKGALEALEGVTAAEVSHEKGTAVVTLAAPVADDVLRAAVEGKGYAVKGIA